MHRTRRENYYDYESPGGAYQRDGYFKDSDDGDANPGPGPGPGPASDSDLDISSVSDITDRELDLELEHIAMQARRRQQSSPQQMGPQPPPPQLREPRVGEESPDEFESDPWNAVATVGLRVYYKAPVTDGKEGQSRDTEEEVVKLRVVRPNPYLPKYDSEDSSSSSESEEDDDDSKGSADDKDKEAKDQCKDDGDGAAGKEDTKKDDPVSSQGLDIDDSSKDATLVGDQEQRRKSILSTQIPPI